MFEYSLFQRIKRTIILPGIATIAILGTVEQIPVNILSIALLWIGTMLSVEAFERFLRYRSLYLGEIYDGISAYILGELAIIVCSRFMYVGIGYRIAISLMVLLFPEIKRAVLNLRYKTDPITSKPMLFLLGVLYMMWFYLALHISISFMLSMICAPVLSLIACIRASGFDLKSPLKKKPSTEITEKTSEYAYFYGCSTQKEIKARYKKLAQLYHPDSDTGDKKSFQRMKTEYEKISKEIRQ